MSKFASNTDNISTPTQDELEKGFAGCGGDGLPMTSANINGVINTISKSIDLNIDNIQELKKQLDAIDLDQAALTITSTDLVLTNEDGSAHKVPLTDLLKLSPDAGNLLEMRDNGVYYGIQASPNLANLYVDAELGDDNVSVEDGGGTIKKPFKTLNHALSLVPNDNSSNIYLKASDINNRPLIYDVNKSVRMTGGAVRTIKAYGNQPFISDEIAQCIRSKTYHWQPMASEQYVRPVVRFNWYKHYVTPQMRQSSYELSGDSPESGFMYLGVHLLLTKSPYDVEEFPIRFDPISKGGLMHVKYSIVTREQGSAAILLTTYSDSRVALEASQIKDNSPNKHLFHLYTGNLDITTHNLSGVSFKHILEECDPNRTIINLDYNALSVVSHSNKYIRLKRHTNGTPLNVRANFSF